MHKSRVSMTDDVKKLRKVPLHSYNLSIKGRLGDDIHRHNVEQVTANEVVRLL